MTQAEVNGGVTGIHVQIDNQCRFVLTRAERREVNRCGCRADSAFHSDERVHPTELPALPMNALHVFFEASQGVAEFGSLQGLLEEIRAPHSHRSKQEFLTYLRRGENRIKRRHGLP